MANNLRIPAVAEVDNKGTKHKCFILDFIPSAFHGEAVAIVVFMDGSVAEMKLNRITITDKELLP